MLKDEAGRVEQKVKEDPNDVASLRDLASLSVALGDPEKSRSLAEQLVKLDAEDYRSWLALVRSSEGSDLYEMFAQLLRVLPASIAAVSSTPGASAHRMASASDAVASALASSRSTVMYLGCNSRHLSQIIGSLKMHRNLLKAYL